MTRIPIAPVLAALLAALLAPAAAAEPATAADADGWPDVRRATAPAEGPVAWAPVDVVRGERMALHLRDLDEPTARVELRSLRQEVLHATDVALDRQDDAFGGLVRVEVPRFLEPGDIVLAVGGVQIGVRVHEGPRVFSSNVAPPEVGERAYVHAAGFDEDAPLRAEIVQGPLRWTVVWSGDGVVDHEAPNVESPARVLGPASQPGRLAFLVAAWDGADVRVWFNGTVAGEAESLRVAWTPPAPRAPGVWLEPVHALDEPRLQAGADAFVHGVGFRGDVHVRIGNASATFSSEDGFFAGWMQVPLDAVPRATVRIDGVALDGMRVEAEYEAPVDPMTRLVEARGPAREAAVVTVTPHAAGAALLAVGLLAFTAWKLAPRSGRWDPRTRSADE